MKNLLRYMILLWVIILFNPLTANAQAEFRNDFGKEKELAQKYSKEKYDEIYNRLPKTLKPDLKSIETKGYKEITELNREMDKKIFNEIKKNRPDLIEIDEKLQKIMKYAEKSKSGQDVYIFVSGEDIGRLDVENIDDEKRSGKIDRNKFNKFIQESDYAGFNGYMIASLHSEALDPNIGYKMRIKLELEKGIPMIYLGNGDVIISKGIFMQVKNDPTISTYKGREIINWNLKVISEDNYENLIIEKEKFLNKIVEEQLNMDNFNRIRLHLLSMRSAASAKRAEDIISNMLSSIPHEILKSTFNSDSPLTDSKLKIYILDVEIPISDIAVGYYADNLNIVFIYPSYPGLMIYHEGTPQYLNTIIHEFGHVVDNIVLNQTIGNDKEAFSSSAEFEALYDEEKNNLTNETSVELYGKVNKYEYFAEVFAAMFSHDNDIRILIRKQVPKTYQFITEHIHMVK